MTYILDRALEITKKLFPSNYAVFVSGDVGVTSLQIELFRNKSIIFEINKIPSRDYPTAEDQLPFEGVFLRFAISGKIYSGIIQASEKNQTRLMLLTIPTALQKEGVDVLSILRLPIGRISMFPLFTILDRLNVEKKKKLSVAYWRSYKDDVIALENWYKDMLKYRRELVLIDFPEFAAAVPSWIGALEVFVLYNERSKTILTRYYKSIKKADTVNVQKTDEPLKLKSDLFSKLFGTPSEENALSEGIVFNIERKRIYTNWGHPFFSATEELKSEIVKFNKLQKRISFYAYNVSETFAFSWTYREISKTRELSTRYPFLSRMLRDWLRPVQAIIRYSIDTPLENSIADGRISAVFVNGSEDKIIVERVKDRKDAGYDENLPNDYFMTSQKPFYGFRTSILHYLDDRFGADH